MWHSPLNIFWYLLASQAYNFISVTCNFCFIKKKSSAPLLSFSLLSVFLLFIPAWSRGVDCHRVNQGSRLWRGLAPHKHQLQVWDRWPRSISAEPKMALWRRQLHFIASSQALSPSKQRLELGTAWTCALDFLCSRKAALSPREAQLHRCTFCDARVTVGWL